MKEVQYIHCLSKMLNECLYRFACAGGQGKVADFLTHTQSCNFHKLRYWGLVKKMGGGEWVITKEGYDFLDGKISVPERVITFQGKVVRHEGLPIFRLQAPLAIWKRNDYAKNSNRIIEEQPRLF